MEEKTQVQKSEEEKSGDGGVKQAQKKEKKKDRFEDAIASFITRMESLQATYPLLIKSLEEGAKKAGEDLHRFLDKCIIERNANQIKLQFRPDQMSELRKKAAATQSAELADVLIPRAMLIVVVSEFDIHLGKLIKAMYFSDDRRLHSLKGKIESVFANSSLL